MHGQSCGARETASSQVGSSAGVDYGAVERGQRKIQAGSWWCICCSVTPVQSAEHVHRHGWQCLSLPFAPHELFVRTSLAGSSVVFGVEVAEEVLLEARPVRLVCDFKISGSMVS